MPPTVLRLLALFVLAATPAASQAIPMWGLAPEWERSWAMEQWTTEDGLPQNSVNDLLQARDGTLWLATFGGLASFDGRSFQVLDLGSQPKLPDNRVLALAEDGSGSLWLGFQFGGLYRMDGTGTGEGVRVLQDVGAVWDVVVASDGAVWAATSVGVFRVAQDREPQRISMPEESGVVRALLATPSMIWVGEARRGLVRYTLEGALDWVAPGLRGAVTDLLERPDGTVWAAVARDVYRVDGDALTRVGGRTEYRQTLFNGPGGRVWVGDEGGLSVGVALDETVESVLRPPASPNAGLIVRAGLVDREGTVWIGTDTHGLIQLRRKALLRFTPADGLPDIARSLVGDGADGAWVGSCGPLAHVTVEGVEVLEKPWGDEACVSEEAADRYGGLWIVGPDRSIHRWYAGRWTVEDPPSPVTIFWGQDGRVFGLTAGSVLEWEDGSWRVAVEPLPDASIVSTAHPLLTDEGILWAATDGGLLRYDGTATAVYGQAQGLASGRVRSIVADGRGGVWVGTYGGGLSHVSERGVRTFTTSEGLAENVISSILMDDSGALWLNGNRFLSLLPAEQVAAAGRGIRSVLEPVSFGASDGFVEGNGMFSVKAANGRLWFPTITGVLTVHPDEVLLNTAPTRIHLDQIVADGTALSLGATTVVPAGTQTLEVRLSIPRFLRPHNLRIRYRLDGGGWVEAGDRPVAVFTDPSPGVHELEAEVLNLEDDARHALSLPFLVEPTLYQTFWFRFSLAFVLLGSLATALLLRDRSLRRTAEVLQAEVDARKAAEVQREAMAAQLLHAQKLEAVGRLTGGIAHDFNNLLAVVLGHVELAAEEVTSEEVREDLLTAQQAAERGAELTRQLLAFARRADLEPAVTDVAALVTGMERFLVPALGSNVALRLVVQEDLWRTKVDAARLENALLNLAFNARDAMPEGGSLTLALRNETLTDPAVLSGTDGGECPPGDYVALAVRDTGTGIPPELIQKVLDPFFSTKDVGKGTGLGLSMAYGFVRQSGGFLTIDSEVGRGTEITIYLPRDASSAGASPAEGAVPRGNGELILVLEDDPGVRSIAVRYLEAVGYRTLEAGSVAQARHTLEETDDVSLVLSDIILPGASGIDFRVELAEKRPELQVLLMSGHGNPRGAPNVAEPDEIFPKPFTREALARKVAEVLRRGKRASPVE